MAYGYPPKKEERLKEVLLSTVAPVAMSSCIYLINQFSDYHIFNIHHHHHHHHYPSWLWLLFSTAPLLGNIKRITIQLFALRSSLFTLHSSLYIIIVIRITSTAAEIQAGGEKSLLLAGTVPSCRNPYHHADLLLDTVSRLYMYQFQFQFQFQYHSTHSYAVVQ